MKSDFVDLQKNLKLIEASQKWPLQVQSGHPSDKLLLSQEKPNENDYVFPSDIGCFKGSQGKSSFVVENFGKQTIFPNCFRVEENNPLGNFGSLFMGESKGIFDHKPTFSSQKTLTDIINDNHLGEPTASDIEKRKIRVEKMLAGKKHKKGEKQKEFLEDKISDNPSESLADMIFHRKDSPSTGNKKISGKRQAPRKWSDKELRLFYKGLEMFGMDFSLMETLFPKRNKKQLLRKFHKEKKKESLKIDNALMNHGKNCKQKLQHFGFFKNNAMVSSDSEGREECMLKKKDSGMLLETGSNSSLDSVDKVSFI